MVGKEIVRITKPTLGEYIGDYFRQNSEIMFNTHKGLADIKAGRVRPWSEIETGLKREGSK